MKQRSFSLPRLSQTHEFPGEQAVTMQLVDSVVHAWDLSRTLDVPLTVDNDTAVLGLAVCEQIPDGESRRKPGAAFGPRLPYSDDAPVLDRIVALLGRSPAWPS